MQRTDHRDWRAFFVAVPLYSFLAAVVLGWGRGPAAGPLVIAAAPGFEAAQALPAALLPMPGPADLPSAGSALTAPLLGAQPPVGAAGEGGIGVIESPGALRDAVGSGRRVASIGGYVLGVQRTTGPAASQPSPAPAPSGGPDGRAARNGEAIGRLPQAGSGARSGPEGARSGAAKPAPAAAPEAGASGARPVSGPFTVQGVGQQPGPRMFRSESGIVFKSQPWSESFSGGLSASADGSAPGERGGGEPRGREQGASASGVTVKLAKLADAGPGRALDGAGTSFIGLLDDESRRKVLRELDKGAGEAPPVTIPVACRRANVAAACEEARRRCNADPACRGGW